MRAGAHIQGGSLLVWGVLLFLVSACAGTSRTAVRSSPGALAACPASPNCVSSDSRSGTHGVAPLEMKVDSDAAWAVVASGVGSLPGCTIVRRTESDLHAECRSRVFRFVDDLDLQRRPDAGIVAVRSASRLGYGDLGVNRRRVEALRSWLAAQGILRQGDFDPLPADGD